MTYSPPFSASSSLRRTRHYDERASQRHLSDDVRDFILAYGVEIQAAGVTHIVVLERRLPIDVWGTEMARRARDWILVVGDDDKLVTCYRRKHAARFVRRKAGQSPRLPERHALHETMMPVYHPRGRAAC